MRRAFRVELLAPAGSVAAMKAAYAAGADAVYIGGSRFGARAFADNLTQEELLAAIDYAHVRGKRLYLTVNTLLKPAELEEELFSYLHPLYERGLDAVIVQDLGVMQAIKEWFPELPIHVSTQLGITGARSASGMRQLGAQRVVLARELKLSEIGAIHSANQDLEVECFVHGALCYCYSGYCLFSSLAGGRSGNRGRCAQPCRMPYTAMDLNHNRLPDQKDGYLLSPKELCTLQFLPELIEAGVYSLKIEGRMKKPEYTAGVTAIYRKYLDMYEKEGKKGYHLEQEDVQKLADLFQRVGFTDGYWKRHNGREMITVQKPLFRTENIAFHEELRANYLQKERERAICLMVTLCKDLPAMLQVDCDGYSIVVEGDLVSKAQKQPLTKEQVEKQLKKTGQSAFYVEELRLWMEEDVFLPVSALNSLRRNALEALEQEIIHGFCRTCAYDKVPVNQEHFLSAGNLDKKSGKIVQAVTFGALATTKMQADVILKTEYISHVYLESACLQSELEELLEQAEKQKKKVYLALPHMLREENKTKAEKMLQKYKGKLCGVLARNPEGLFLAKKAGIAEITTDFGIYTFQNKARSVLKQLGVCADTAPLELNFKELSQRGLQGSMLVVYGYAPMMITANCIKKTTGQCKTASDPLVFLEDRKKNRFFIRTFCEYCYNVIYNFLPTSLHEYAMDLCKIAQGDLQLRLDFTVEDEKTTQTVLNAFCACTHGNMPQLGNDFQFTRGHLRRGVE